MELTNNTDAILFQEEESRAKIKKLKAEIVTKAKNQKVEKNETKTDKLPKVTDYSTWDKYDVEGECARLDMDSSNESDISDEIDETKMNLAKEEKEKVCMSLYSCTCLIKIFNFREINMLNYKNGMMQSHVTRKPLMFMLMIQFFMQIELYVY